MDETFPQRLDRLMKEKGFNPRSLSLAANLNVTAVRDIIEGKSRRPRYATIEALAGCLGVQADYLASGKLHAPAMPLPPTEAVQITGIPVLGAVQAGEWVEAVEWDREDWYQVSAPRDSRYPGLQRYGLEVRGPSMNELYPEGSVVICVRLVDLGREPRQNERVVVERRRQDGCVEATVKEYRQSDGTIWLWPRSSHPSFQQPIPYTTDGDEEVYITGLVVGSYRAE